MLRHHRFMSKESSQDPHKERRGEKPSEKDRMARVRGRKRAAGTRNHRPTEHRKDTLAATYVTARTLPSLGVIVVVLSVVVVVISVVGVVRRIVRRAVRL